MEIKESVSISQSPEKIWGFWMQVTTDVQWRDGMTKAEFTSQPPYGIGTTGTHFHKNFGALPWTIIRWEDGRHMEWVFGESKMKDCIGSYHVEPDSGGSRVTLHAKLVGPLLMRIILFFMRGRITRGVKGDLQKLKEIMEK
jgi:hypothetical protein